MVRSVGFASLAAVALFAVCAGAAPTPAPRASPKLAPTAAPSAAASPPASAKPALPSLETLDYRVETDDITYKGNGDFTMPHHVSLARPGSDAVADHADGNQKRGTIKLFGSVVVHDNGNAPEAASNDEYAKGGPSTLTCDELDVDSKAKVYTAIGHVHFEQAARKADAARGVLNRGTGMLHLEGDVKTTDGASTLTAKELDYNLSTKKISADGKPIVIKQPVPTPAPGSVSPSPKPKKLRLPFPV
jgi:lipopolysaccharide export system protein LptA